MNTAHELVFMGTGAACGSPTFYCGCVACEEALANPAEAKTCSSLAVVGGETTLIDTAPELRLQCAHTGVRHIHRVLYTHEHFDHTGGLPQLEYAVRLSQDGPLPVYATARCLAWLESHFDWMWDTVEPHIVQPFQTLEFDGVSYTALPAAHCPDALGYLIDVAGWRAAYFPDTGPLSAEVRERLKGVNVLIHDATFIGRNWYPGTHTTVDEVVQLGRDLGAATVFLAHCSMHFDEPHTAESLRKKLDALGMDGMRVVLPRDGMRIPAKDASDS